MTYAWIAVMTGARMGEIRELRVADLRDKAGFVTIHRAPKSGAERRVPVVPGLALVPEGATKGKLPDALVAHLSDGTAPTRQRVLRALRNTDACQDAAVGSREVA